MSAERSRLGQEWPGGTYSRALPLSVADAEITVIGKEDDALAGRNQRLAGGGLNADFLRYLSLWLTEPVIDID